MPDFKFPGDCRSLPEFRLFESALVRLGQPAQPHALWAYATLKIILSYDAEVTGRPGFLSQQSAQLFSMDLKGAGLDPDVIFSAMRGNVLKPVEGGFVDEQFAKKNAELSPKHRRHVDVGAE